MKDFIHFGTDWGINSMCIPWDIRDGIEDWKKIGDERWENDAVK